MKHIDINLADDGTFSGFRLEAIDLKGFLASEGAERDEIAACFDRGLQEIGFAAIYNHGIDNEFLDRMTEITGRFFDLDPSQKTEVASRPSVGKFCGWVSFAADSASKVYGAGDEAPPDLRERYRAVLSAAAEIRERVGPNQWPSTMPEFESMWREYYKTFEEVAMQVMMLAARALGQPDEFFEPYYEEHFSVLMSTLSPPVHDRASGQNRCGAHTDTGTMTFVYQPTPRGGVQVQLPDGRWGSPKTTKGDIIVNCADLLAVWTNDRWKSTIHRVGGPADRLDERRQSVVFFHQPALDVSIESLRGCSDAVNPAKYEPITLREHFDHNQKQLDTKEEPLGASA